MKTILFLPMLLVASILVSTSAHAYKTKRVAPRESCGKAENFYCLDVTEKEVPCHTRAAEWKVCVYEGDEEELAPKQND